MKQVVMALVITLACVLTVVTSAAAQQSDDIKPGHTFPKPGYFPDPHKVVFVVFWHDKKDPTKFGFQDYFMEADGVNDTTARKMVKLMEERYPNLVVYMHEWNERDVEARVNSERKRIKNIDKDWVEVKQPTKIEPPQKVGDKKYDYSKLVIVETPKENKKTKSLEGTRWTGTVETKKSGRTIGSVTFQFDKSGKFEGRGKVYTSSGTWAQEGNSITLTYSNGGAMTLTIQGDQLSGRASFANDPADEMFFRLKLEK